jgi:hypothetical protein
MDWQTSTSFPSSVPTPQLETSEVSSGAELLCITQTVYFRSRFNIESSGILTNVLDAVGLGEFSGKQNFFIFKKLVIEQTNNACGHVGYTFSLSSYGPPRGCHGWGTRYWFALLRKSHLYINSSFLEIFSRNHIDTKMFLTLNEVNLTAIGIHSLGARSIVMDAILGNFFSPFFFLFLIIYFFISVPRDVWCIVQTRAISCPLFRAPPPPFVRWICQMCK